MTPEIILGMILAGILSNNYPLIECLGTGAVLEKTHSIMSTLSVFAFHCLYMKKNK